MDAQQPTTTQTVELSEAQLAYQMALQRLEDALPHREMTPVVIDPTSISWPKVLLRALLAVPVTLFGGLFRVLNDAGGEAGNLTRDIKTRLLRFAQGSPVIFSGPQVERRRHIRQLLLEALWARDHVQEAIERREGASYESRRGVLDFVMSNEARLQRLGQRALEAADLETSELREVQPTPPSNDRWWWFLNYPRAKRARRLNTIWFIFSLIPALASVVLVTLLAQRLAINGPDLLSGASVFAQVGIGLASIIAGREILKDLILKGVTSSWQGKLTFSLASLFLIVVIMFYFAAPPGAALIYNIFGQQAIREGNAAEAELYLESAARLDPDPHAGSLLEVGCLYQTLGSPGRAQTVFERVLEADSRLLLARYHLAQLYIDQGDTDQALQLLEDGQTLLDRARVDMMNGNKSFLPGLDTLDEADEMEYLMWLSRGRAYLESNAPQQARNNLSAAEGIFITLSETSQSPEQTAAMAEAGRADMSCGPDDNLRPFVLGTELNLHFYLALTYDALCGDDPTINAALEEWRLVRNGRPANSRQEAWRDEAIRRLSSQETCRTGYGGIVTTSAGGETVLPGREG
ncbi:MAG: tetratricopeptide repeat protein [Chloroflexi bacterium]|nr:tetratricopeptide repeat protein [Chloroflexota bacterium]